MSRLASQLSSFPDLTAWPLIVAIDSMRAPFETDAELGPRVGTSDRSLREWRSGKRSAVQFGLADRILCELGLNWWEVWDEDTTRVWALRVITYKPSTRPAASTVSAEVVEAIRSSDESPTVLAQRYGLSRPHVCEIRSGKRSPFGRRRDRLSVRFYGDLGPDLEALAAARYAFTGEGRGEQLELAA